MTVKAKKKTMEQMAKHYKKLVGKKDYGQPLRASAKMIAANNIRRFDKEKDSKGEAWKPLTPKYLKWKLNQSKKKTKGKKSQAKKRNKSQKINVLTGRLRTSIKSNSDSLAYYKITPLAVSFGTKVHYAKYVQKIRPIIGISTEDIKEMNEIFRLWIARKWYLEGKTK